MPINIHTSIYSFIEFVETFVEPCECQALCWTQSAQMHRADEVLPSWSTKHSGTSRSQQTPDFVFSKIPSESNFIGLVSDPSPSQPKSEQLGLPKESYETAEGIHRAAGDVE